MPDPKLFSASVIAETFVAKAKGGVIGVIGEYLPKFDQQALVDNLTKSLGKKPYRLALLGTTTRTVKPGGKNQVTYSVTEANKWRNDAETRGGKQLFVAVVGMVPKLTSLLNTLYPVAEEDLRAVLTARISAYQDMKEHQAFWNHLRQSVDEFTLESMLSLGADCEEVVTKSGRHDLIELETKGVWKLGLIPDTRLFESKGEKNVERFVRQNLETVKRLNVLTKKDRLIVTKILDDEDSDKGELRETAKRILEYDRTRRDKLQHLDYRLVLEVFGYKGSKLPTPPQQRIKDRALGDEAAIEDVLDHDGKNIKDISDGFESGNEDESGDDVAVGGRTIIKKRRTGTSTVEAAVNQLITEENFGGVILSEVATDYIDCLKHLSEGEAKSANPFLPNSTTDKYAVRKILERTVDHYAGTLTKDALGMWEKYRLARKEVLQYKHDLSDHPLLAMLGEEGALVACEKLIKAYGEMMEAVAYIREVIRQKNPDASKYLMSRAMAMDVIFLRFGEEAVAIAGPTHPFHLWRWVEIARLMKDKKAVRELKEIGEELVLKHAANPPAYSPHIILNRFVDETDRPKDYVFTGVGSIGALPLYGDAESRLAAKFRAGEIGDVALYFIRMSPYANYGFEVVAIDPPSIPDLIESLTKINQGRARTELIPIHLRVFRTREIPSSTDEEDSEIEELASVVRQTKGSIEIESRRINLKTVCDYLSQRPAHYTLVFEPGDVTSFKVGLNTSPTLSPLVVPRHYNYAPLDDQFDVVIQGETTPFGAYYELFCDLMSIPKGDTIGRRSGASRWIRDIAKVGEHTMWLSVIDQGIEATFKIPDAIRIDKRNVDGGGRDIQTFTSHKNTILRHVGKIVEIAGLIPDQATTDRTFGIMRTLGGDTVPLAFSRVSDNGTLTRTHARGLLGVLAVTSWYEKFASDVLLTSLDSSESRSWILGANDDNLRGDLIAIRQTAEGLHLEVLEVKVREDERLVYNSNGGGSGNFTGHAVDQVDSTIRILKRIMKPDCASKVDCARREILRDQLYMAVANREMDSVRRERAVQMLNQFFESGAEKVTGRVFVVHVESHTLLDFPAGPKRVGKSPEGNTIEAFEITESEVQVDEPGFKQAAGEIHKLACIPPATAIATPKMRGKGVEVEIPIGSETDEGSPPDKNETVAPLVGALSKLPTSFSVLIGKTPTGNDVVWDTGKNPNFGFLVTGDSGSGKTQTIRAVMQELRRIGFPVLVFDFKNDYSDPMISAQLNLNVYDVVQSGLPFNPLSLIPDDKGMVQPIRQCYEFANIVARVEGLKEQQTHRLVEAQRLAYENHGLEPNVRIPIEKVASEPLFDEVLENLRNDGDKVSDTVVFRLQKFSDLGLFPKGPVKESFEELIRDGVVLTLADSSNDKLMTILAEIMIVKIHATVKRGDQPRVLRRALVFDEAWRIANSQRLVELGREGRAFGVGLIVGTQNPKDLPETLISSLRTQLFLYNKDPENQRILVRALCNTTSGPDALQRLKVISQLSTLQGYFINEQYKEGVRVNVIPHKDRI